MKDSSTTEKGEPSLWLQEATETDPSRWLLEDLPCVVDQTPSVLTLFCLTPGTLPGEQQQDLSWSEMWDLKCSL